MSFKRRKVIKKETKKEAPIYCDIKSKLLFLVYYICYLLYSLIYYNSWLICLLILLCRAYLLILIYFTWLTLSVLLALLNLLCMPCLAYFAWNFFASTFVRILIRNTITRSTTAIPNAWSNLPSLVAAR